MNAYISKIQELTSNISASLVDFNSPRDKGRMPTQASSNLKEN